MICWFGSLGADNKRRLEKSVKCSQNTVGIELNDIFVRLEPLGGKRPVWPDPQNSLHASCKASLLAAGEGRGFGSSFYEETNQIDISDHWFLSLKNPKTNVGFICVM